MPLDSQKITSAVNRLANMIRPGFLSEEEPEELRALGRDGRSEARASRRANSIVLLDIIATAAFICATVFPLIWAALAMRAPRLLPVLASASISPAITVSPSTSSSSRYASKPVSDVTTDHP